MQASSSDQLAAAGQGEMAADHLGGNLVRFDGQLHAFLVRLDHGLDLVQIADARGGR